MTILDNAIQQLKEALEKINEGGFTVDMRPLEDNLEASQATFANPALLPTGISVYPSEYTLPAESQYPQMVLQASWNILDIIRAINDSNRFIAVGVWLYRKSDFQACFNYFDELKLSPKIVDDKTYQVGLALQQFANSICNDEASQKKLGETITHSLSEMKANLETSLAFYKAHSPENIAKSVHELQELNKQTALLNEKIADFKEKTDMQTLAPVLMESKDMLEEKCHFTACQVADLNSLLATVVRVMEQNKTIIQDIDDHLTTYEAFIENWQRQNQNLALPERIYYSNYIDSLASEDSEASVLIHAWLSLFNGDELLYQEPQIECEKQLQGAYELRDKAIFAQQVFKDTLAALEARHQNLNALLNYFNQINHGLAALDTQPQLPQSITRVEPAGYTYHIDLSRNVDENIRNQEDLVSYNALINDIDGYLLDLQKQVDTLQQHYDGFKEHYPLPESMGIDESSFIEAYNNANEKTGAILAEKKAAIEQEYTLLHHLKKNITYGLAQFSTTGRKMLLAWADEDIRASEAAAQESRLRAIEVRNAAILNMSLTEAITSLHQRANERRTQLDNDIVTINNFIRDLDTHEGPYIPADKVPLGQVLALLETSDTSLINTINATYARQNNAQAHTEFNLLSRLSTLFFGDSPDLGIQVVKSALENKRQQMIAELAIDIHQPVGTALLLPDSVDNNLYKLQTQYQPLSACYEAEIKAKLQTLQAEQDKMSRTLRMWGFRQDDSVTQVLKLRTLLAPEAYQATENLQTLQNILASGQDAFAALSVWTGSDENSNQVILDDFASNAQSSREAWLTLKTLFKSSKTNYWHRLKNAMDSNEDSEQDALLQDMHNDGLPISKDLFEQLKRFWQERNRFKHTQEMAKKACREMSRLRNSYDQLHAAVLCELESNDARKPQHSHVVSGNLKPSSVDPIKALLNNPIILDFNSRISQISVNFFGESPDIALGGIFGDYLKERAKTFFLRDFCSKVMAFFLGVFGYETEAEKRQIYISSLKTAVDNYQASPEAAESLSQLVEKGLSSFKPRAADTTDEPENTFSLRHQLKAFKDALTETKTLDHREEAAAHSPALPH